MRAGDGARVLKRPWSAVELAVPSSAFLKWLEGGTAPIQEDRKRLKICADLPLARVVPLMRMAVPSPGTKWISTLSPGARLSAKAERISEGSCAEATRLSRVVLQAVLCDQSGSEG